MVDYKYGFGYPVEGDLRPLRPDYDTFHARLRPHHSGIDTYPAVWGARLPVIALANGKVRRTDLVDNSAAGVYIEVLHPGNPGWYLTRYLHLLPGSVLVKPGDQVAKGQRIGTLDTTGNANAAHLHLEIRYDPNQAADQSTVYGSTWGTAYDPELFGVLTPAEQFGPLVRITVDKPTLRRDNSPYTVHRAVKDLQALLAVRGLIASNTFNDAHEPDGKFGPGTEAAVKSFQKQKGLTEDGVVGVATWTILEDY